MVITFTIGGQQFDVAWPLEGEIGTSAPAVTYQDHIVAIPGCLLTIVMPKSAKLDDGGVFSLSFAERQQVMTFSKNHFSKWPPTIADYRKCCHFLRTDNDIVTFDPMLECWQIRWWVPDGLLKNDELTGTSRRLIDLVPKNEVIAAFQRVT